MKSIYKHPQLLAILPLAAIVQLGSNLISPIVPEILAYYGESAASGGLVQSLFFLPGIVLAPLYGFIADRFGRLKALIPALILFGISGLAIFFATNFTIFLMLRVLQGAGAAAMLPLTDILTGDVVKKKELPSAIGATNTIFALSMAAYPTIGGLLYLFDWRWIFCSFTLGIVVLILIVWKLGETKPNITKEKESKSTPLKTIVNPRIWLLFLAAFSMGFLMWAHLGSYFSILLQQRYAIGSTMRGYLLSAVWLLVALINTQRGRFVKAVRRSYLILIGLISWGAALSLLILQSSFEIVLISLVLYGVGISLVRPGVSGCLLSRSPVDCRAAVLSVNGMIQRIGQSSGPYIMGLILVSGTITEGYLFLSGYVGLAILVTITSLIIGRTTAQRKEE
ncbi:MAG: MFS transporter [Candidatus Ranarchaeia archaeon]